MRMAQSLLAQPEWALIPFLLAQVEDESISDLGDRELSSKHSGAISRLQMVHEFRRTIRATALHAGVQADPFPGVP